MEQEPQQVKQEPKEPQQVTTKDPKKVKAGKRLAATNRKEREAKKREERAQLEKSRVNQYYRIGAVIAVGVIGGFGCYIYRSKKAPTIREVMIAVSQQPWGLTATPGPQGPAPRLTSLRWINLF